MRKILSALSLLASGAGWQSLGLLSLKVGFLCVFTLSSLAHTHLYFFRWHFYKDTVTGLVEPTTLQRDPQFSFITSTTYFQIRSFRSTEMLGTSPYEVFIGVEGVEEQDTTQPVRGSFLHGLL